MTIDTERRDALFADAERIHADHAQRAAGRFTTFVPCDYAAAFDALVVARADGDSFVELGSGAGVVTILADLLGFDAVGIELDPWLVGEATGLAARHGSAARFVEGTFVPRGMRDAVADQPADFLTETDGPDAWAELGLELADFDVVYDWHWPHEAAFHDDMLRRYGRPGTVILRFDADHGFEATRL